MALHFGAIGGEQIIRVGGEQRFAIVPGRGDKWNAASESLEHADRRDAGQRHGIGSAWDMHRRSRCGKCLRHAEVRQISGEFDPGFGKLRLSFGRVAHPVHTCRQPERPHRLDQKLAKLGGALLVAPIAEPDEVALLCDFRPWIKHRSVGGLVPGKDLVAPAAPPVGIAQRLAKGEHAVEPVEIEGGDCLRLGQQPMMRVVEQQQVSSGVLPVCGNARDQRRLIPLMQQHKIGAVERAIEIESGRVVDDYWEVGVRTAPRLQRRRA